MKPHELRLGNMVMYKGREIVVESISQAGINMQLFYDGNGVDGDPYNEWVPFSEISAIPLNFAILEDYRFVVDVSYDCPMVQKDALVLFGYDNEFGANFGHTTQLDASVKYLHQLQNLHYVLTGEELNFRAVPNNIP